MCVQFGRRVILDLCRVNQLSLEPSFRKMVVGEFTVYAKGHSFLSCQRTFHARQGTLVMSQQQLSLILDCDDGRRRSFGQGSLVRFQPRAVSSTAA